MSDRERSDHEAQRRALEDEIAVLRRRLEDAPRRVKLLGDRLLEARNHLSQAQGQNEKLSVAGS